MNYKIYSSIAFLLFFSLQLLVAQNAKTDQNGRTRVQLAHQKDINSQNDHNQPIAVARGGGEGEDKDEGVYTRDESITGNEELDALNLKLQALADKFAALELSEAQLQTEVNDIKKSLEMCCGGGSLIDDEGQKSYLLQNTPNPFYENTNIQYFIPSDATTANLQIRDLSGKILKSYNLEQKGIAAIKVARKAFESGSYVYTLEVDGKIVDSKIMILTR